MSKLANMLNMLLLLKRNGKMKIGDLSYELGVSPRQIRSYSSDLEQSGIFIKSETGKNGGYSIEDEDFKIPFELMMNNSDKVLIEILASNMDLDVKNAYNQFKAFVTSHEMTHIFTSTVSIDEIRHLMQLYLAITERNVVQIDYLMNHDFQIKKTLHPYFSFKRYNNWYILGFDPFHKKPIMMKLNRMLKVSMLPEKYIIDKSVLETEKKRLENQVGIYNTGKVFEVILRLEKSIKWALDNLLIGDIETMEENERNFTIKFKTSSIKELKRQILYLGSECMVIKPASLIQLIQQEIMKIGRIYETYS